MKKKRAKTKHICQEYKPNKADLEKHTAQATREIDKSYTKPKYVGLKDHERTWKMSLLFRLYRLIRFVFVTIWFYYLPVVVMALGYLVPLWTSWQCKVNDKSGSRLIRGVCIDPMQYAEGFGKL